MNYAPVAPKINPEPCITYTVFPDKSASAKREVSGPWSELAELVKNPATHASKHDCPLMVLGTFGERRTEKGCLRTAENRLTVTGIELDYDGEQVTLQEAAWAFAQMGVKALLFTSASHTAEKPRWRVLLPLAEGCSPSDRARYVGRANGLLGGITARESFDEDRSYFFGRVNGATYEVQDVDGDCIDTMPDLDAGAIFPSGASKAAANDHLSHDDDLVQIGINQHPATDQQLADISSALAFLAGEGYGRGYFEWEGIGQALKATASMGDGARETEVVELWCGYSGGCGGHKGKPENLEPDALKKWAQLGGNRTGMGAIFNKAQELGWMNPQTLRAAKPDDTVSGPLPTMTDWSDVMSNPPAPQVHAWGSCTPVGEVTLLGAHGGTGKSTLALQMALHVATGMPFMGLPVTHGKAVFYSGEDCTPALRRRLRAICMATGVDPVEAAKHLLVMDATEWPTLYTASAGGRTGAAAQTTPVYAHLLDVVRRERPVLLVIDNASDTYDANEIERARVREFIRHLKAMHSGTAVLPLAHLAKASVTGRNASNPGDSEDYSGSTAWHNSARSRLSLRKASDQGALVLTHQKVNYGLLQSALSIRFDVHGVLELNIDPAHTGLTPQEVREAKRQTLLRMIEAAYTRGEFISPSWNGNSHNVHRATSSMQEYPMGMSREECKLLIEELVRDGYLLTEEYRTDTRKSAKRLLVCRQSGSDIFK